MKNNIYIIDGHEFRLKDLTFDESEKVNKMLEASGNTISVSEKDSVKFLKLILEPVSEDRRGDLADRPLSLWNRLCNLILGSDRWNPAGGVNFHKTTESTAAEVLCDFFTNRRATRLSIINSIVGLPGEVKKSSMNISP